LEEDSDAVIADAMSLFGLVIGATPGQISKANFYIEQTLALHQKIGDLYGLAMDYLHLSCVLNQTGQGSVAISMVKNSLQFFEQLNDVWGKGRCYQMLGQLSIGLGQYTEASWFFNQQLDADTQVDFSRGQLYAWAGLKYKLRQSNDLASAGAMLTSDTVSNFDRELNEISSEYIPCFS
jgi:hypothetical protein